MGGFRDLAARAKYDPVAATRFNESRLSVNTDPWEAMAVLREHPLIRPVLEDSGQDEGVRYVTLNTKRRSSLRQLVLSLAKLSIKEGPKRLRGACTAT